MKTLHRHYYIERIAQRDSWVFTMDYGYTCGKPGRKLKAGLLDGWQKIFSWENHLYYYHYPYTDTTSMIAISEIEIMRLSIMCGVLVM